MSQVRRTTRIHPDRTTAEVLQAVAATLALLALVVGVPFALLTFFGSPWPDRLPTAADLSRRLGPGALITVLVTLVWLAWLQLAACTVVEVYAGVRGIGVPIRVPLAGGTQSLVHRLVVTALLLFTATTAVVPVFTRDLHAAPPMQSQSQQLRPITGNPDGNAPGTVHGTVLRSDHGVHHGVDHGLAHGLARGLDHDVNADADLATESAVAGSSVRTPKARKIYRVQPPHGRHHESLWEIADKCLGDGRRYREIYELNKGRVQPDGSRLTIASLIRPGWILEMPDDAVGVQIVPAHGVDDQRTHGGARSDRQAAEPLPKEHLQHSTDRHEQPPPPEHPAQAHLPTSQAPPGSQQAPQGSSQHPSPHSSPHSSPRSAPGSSAQDVPGALPATSTAADSHDLGWPQGLAVASLLAAGVLAALGRRRREQMWHRAFGHMISTPHGEAAVAEQALRFGADGEATRLLDLGLRQMSKALATDGRTPPTIYGVHLGTNSMDLWIAPADRNPPAPWEAHDDGQVWRLRRDQVDAPPLAREALEDVLAPYPGLVSIGRNQSGHILVDLEAAQGLIALRGSAQACRSVLAAIAIELATNRWSDHMRITLVGFGAELSAIAPDRVRAVSSLAEALPDLEARAEEVRQALAASGVDSVLTGRCRGVFGEAWMPHYLIMADQPTPAETDRLVTLARAGRRMAAGYLVPGEVQGATWTWDVTADGRLRAGVLGFDVEAQSVPEQHYRAVVELFRTAGRVEGVPLPQPREEPPPAMTPMADHRPTVDVRLLGAIEVDAPGPMDDDRRDVCTEVLIYLATHPGGVHPTVLGGAVWPRGVTVGVRDATIARVRDWLGRDSRGRPNLYYDTTGRIRLGSEVRVDWSALRWLIWRSAAEPASEAAYISHALELIRGPLLADRPRGRYAWLAVDGLEHEVVARVVDMAHRLVVRRLDDRDARGAIAAARAGLRLAPEDEGLWRDLLRATNAAGDRTQVLAVASELRRRIGRTFGRLQPETEALVQELVPRSRQAFA